MTNEKKKLIAEVDELQGFIDTCEIALDHGLGLDEATYDKYNRAIERQRELGEQLEGLDDSPRGLYTSAQLMRKEPELRVDRCKVEAVVELDRNRFADFRTHLFENQEFIKEYRDLMYQDRDGVSHCLLVLGEGEEDGILVEGEGSLYARYSALLPNARGYMQKQIQTMAEDLIKQGTAQTANGSWVIGFDEISQHFDTTITFGNCIGQLLLDELVVRDEISELSVGERGLEMKFCYDNNLIADDSEATLKASGPVLSM